MPLPDRMTVELEQVHGGLWIGVARDGQRLAPGSRMGEPEEAASDAVAELRAAIRREDRREDETLPLRGDS